MSESRVAIALALVHKRGRWLVARRPAGVHLEDLWEFPGGKCEEGESFEQAALRELEEECGVSAEVECVLDAVGHDYGDRSVMLQPVICRWVAGEARPRASAAVRWVTVGELVTLPMPAGNDAIRGALERLAGA
jgi:mutator protein MutT